MLQLLLMLPLFFAASTKPSKMPVIEGNGKSGPPSADYKLVWSDDFDGTTLDETKWDYRLLGKRRDAVNAEDSVSLDGKGHLVITTKKVGDEVHCGMISTDKEKQWTYGYFECSAKMAKNIGAWGAFWMQSDDMQTIGDPAKNGEEIDIFEYFKHHGAGVIDHAVLWNGYGKKGGTTGQIKRLVPTLDEGFHTFGMEWTPTEYVFYVDGVESWRSTKVTISHHPEYIILSTEMLRSYGFDETKFPDSVEFDYVRVYQRAGDATKPAS